MRKKTPLSPAPVAGVRLTGGFLGRVSDTVRDQVIPYQWEALNDRVPGAVPSHCVHNFKVAAGEETGEFGGWVFQDSDLAKWIEAAAYAIATKPDPALEKTVAELIALVGRAQQADGYLNTHFIIKAPDERYKNLRDWHELYCAGHMMEAAVAWYDATGSRDLIDIMARVADNIAAAIGPEEGKLRGYPGHEEIELALVKMYRATGDERFLRQARYFIDERGQAPNFFRAEHPEDPKEDVSYWQAHLPVREQTTVEGHSVRALYLLAGMLDVAVETGDKTLLDAAKKLFANATEKRMYVTGGVGSTHHGEAFSFDYDLPNDTAYSETCASIALAFCAQRLMQIAPDGRIADVLETALYNTCIAGMSLDGTRFFYVNPLDVLPEASHKDPGKRHALPQRPPWFGCACCPPNLARLIGSLGAYLYSTGEGAVWAHLFASSEATLDIGGTKATIRQETAYPYDGAVTFTLSAGAYGLRARVPGWCKGYTVAINGEAVTPEVRDGYLVIDRDWQDGDTVALVMDMPARRVWAHTAVVEDIGKVCVARGPLVYCAEEADNGAGLWRIRLPRDAEIAARQSDILGGVVTLHTKGVTCAADAGDAPLYRDAPPVWDTPVDLTLIPYYAWANRGEGEMAVWLREG